MHKCIYIQYTEHCHASCDGFRTAFPIVIELLRGHSIQLNPGDAKTLQAAAERLDPGTEVSLAWIPGSYPMDTTAQAASLKRAGHIPVPHVGARVILRARFSSRDWRSS